MASKKFLNNYVNNILTQDKIYIDDNFNKLPKASDDLYPSFSNCNMILNYNFTLKQLNNLLLYYNIPLGGNKREIVIRIFTYLKLNKHAIKIQKIFRGFLRRNYFSLLGPAFKNKNLCNNNIDFFTMDDFTNLKLTEFFSYKDDDGFIYGFDIVSFYNLVKTSQHNNALNPYNRNKIPAITINNMKKILQYNKIFDIKLNINIEPKISTQIKSVDIRALELFRNIDYLGNYTNHQWFLALNTYKLLKLIREINEVWTFRLNIPIEVKRNIYPPYGDIFRNIRICVDGLGNSENSLNVLRGQVLEVMERLVNTGVNADSRSLGSCYVLGALTLVSDEAAVALPWLYQSFSYF
jgi:hypothetical protein